jgi:excisionase family DNA binding protein
MQPLAVPLPHAPAVTGLSRSTIYREAARGNIRLLKVGRSTLVDMASVRAFLTNLPTASIRASQQAT